MKRVAINQSNYIPWKGFFDLIHDVDLFVFHDDVQFTVQDWRNRNKLKTPQGAAWLTIPVGSDQNRLICEVVLDPEKWQRKHWRTVGQHYSRAPFFGRYEGLFREIYLEREWRNLSELNQELITRIARECLGIRTEFVDSSRFALTTRKQQRVIDILQAASADVYVSGPAAKAYLDPENFRKKGIALIWKDYAGYPEYPQFYPPFIHAVSIVDLLFQVGPEAPDYIWGWREKRPNARYFGNQITA